MLKTIKTIKTTKYMRLDELIMYVRENKKTLFKGNVTFSFKTKNNNEVIFYQHGELTLDNWISSVDLFEVEEEKEITEDTELDCVISVDSDGYTFKNSNATIDYLNSIYSDLVQILANIDGKYRTVWERED